eukprot:m.43281 g.43281  ORF g.43281 m.43281 type:complete len:78 (+) comp9962_c0_seq1:46-279(+)
MILKAFQNYKDSKQHMYPAFVSKLRWYFDCATSTDHEVDVKMVSKQYAVIDSYYYYYLYYFVRLACLVTSLASSGKG